MATPVYDYITTSGVIVADTSAILTDVQSEFQNALGQDMTVSPNSRLGVIVNAEAIARAKVVNNNAALANQINPNIAGGVFLDAIMALLGKSRRSAGPSIVTAQLTGVAGTVITAGLQAQTTNGDAFILQGNVTLDGSGNGTGIFWSAVNGPIPINANTLTQISNGGILGWETVNNSSAGTLGTLQQSDVSARSSRRNGLGFLGKSLASAIIAAVYDVAGVQSLFFQENTASTTQTINGISMVAHSYYVCVNGGADTDVATAMLESKSSGGGWNGGTTVNVTEAASGQSYPVSFDRPTNEPIVVRVTIAANTAPTNATADIQQAILDYAAGNIEGLDGFVVGGNVSPFEIAGAIASEFPGIYIRKVEASLASSVSYSTNEIPIAVNQIASVNVSDITVLST